MHPEFFAADTTFGTNNEKKELFTMAFKDGTNKAFNGGRAYIPNAQRWVFELIFRECLPVFWGKEICSKIKLVLTDGCSEEYLSFVNNCGMSNSFPNAVHGLCYFHLVVLGWKKHVQPSIPKSGHEEKLALETCSIIQQWVKSWFFYIESEAEFVNSKQLLFNFLEKEKNRSLSENLVQVIVRWFKSSLEPLESLWTNYQRLHIAGLGAKCTSIAEALHWSIKSGFDGVRAGFSIENAASNQMSKAERKAKQNQRSNALKMQKTNLWSHFSTKDDLTDYAERSTFQQWEKSIHCNCVALERNIFLVHTPTTHDFELCKI